MVLVILYSVRSWSVSLKEKLGRSPGTRNILLSSTNLLCVPRGDHCLSWGLHFAICKMEHCMDRPVFPPAAGVCGLWGFWSPTWVAGQVMGLSQTRAAICPCGISPFTEPKATFIICRARVRLCWDAWSWASHLAFASNVTDCPSLMS